MDFHHPRGGDLGPVVTGRGASSHWTNTMRPQMVLAGVGPDSPLEAETDKLAAADPDEMTVLNRRQFAAADPGVLGYRMHMESGMGPVPKRIALN